MMFDARPKDPKERRLWVLKHLQEGMSRHTQVGSTDPRPSFELAAILWGVLMEDNGFESEKLLSQLDEMAAPRIRRVGTRLAEIALRQHTDIGLSAILECDVPCVTDKVAHLFAEYRRTS